MQELLPECFFLHSLLSPAGGGMSLSPVFGTEVPETANGVVTSVSLENGPHAPASVKCGGSRLPGTGEEPLDGSPEHTENNAENKVYTENNLLDTQTDLNHRTSSLSLNSPQEADVSLDDGTSTGDSESKDIPSKTGGAHNLVLLLDSAQQGETNHSCPRGGPFPTGRQQTGSIETGTERREEEDGEKEKQDEEKDEKSENKWRSSEGRTEMAVSGQ